MCNLQDMPLLQVYMTNNAAAHACITHNSADQHHMYGTAVLMLLLGSLHTNVLHAPYTAGLVICS